MAQTAQKIALMSSRNILFDKAVINKGDDLGMEGQGALSEEALGAVGFVEEFGWPAYPFWTAA